MPSKPPPERFGGLGYSNSPPDLEDIIRRGQAKYGGGDSFMNTNFASYFLGVCLLAFTISIAGALYYVDQKIATIQTTIDRVNTMSEKLPAAADRIEKLVDRVDATVQRSTEQLKKVVPETSKGLLDGIRKGLGKEVK